MATASEEAVRAIRRFIIPLRGLLALASPAGAWCAPLAGTIQELR